MVQRIIKNYINLKCNILFIIRRRVDIVVYYYCTMNACVVVADAVV